MERNVNKTKTIPPNPASIQLMTLFVPFKLSDNLFGLI